MCDAGSAVATKTLIKPPTVSAAPGTILSQLEVTGTDPTPANPGTTLKVACGGVGRGCPAAAVGGWVAVSTSGQPEQVSTLSNGIESLVGGAEYDCWSAEFDDTDVNNRVCSETSSSAVVPLAPPTVLAASGSFVDEVLVTGTNPVPQNALDVTMKVACVAIGQDCPAKDAGGWVSATSTVGERVSTLADGSTNLVGGTSYTCWSAQFDAHGNYKCSVEGDNATAALLNRPTVVAVTGTVAGQVSVTGTDSITPNQGTTLKVACGASTAGCPAYDANGWVDATTDVAVQVSTLSDGTTDLVGGTTYKCWALEYQTDDPPNSICSSVGADVTANPLNAPSVTAATGTAQAIAVTATAPSSPANTGTTLKMVCVVKSGASQPACPAASNGGWTLVTTSGSPQVIDGLDGGDVYTCFSAEFANSPVNSYRVCSTGADAMAGIIAPDTPTAVPGGTPGTIDVTAVAPSTPSNVDTTLKIVCVVKTGSSQPDCPAASDNTVGWTDSTTPTQAIGGLDEGEQYTCFAAEFANSPADTYRVCSVGADTVAALNAPTVTAAIGTVPDQVSVTATLAGTNTGTTLKVACVPTTGATCPNASGAGITWTDATTAIAQQIGVTVDGTAMDGGESYTCYSAEFVGTDYRVCSTGIAVTAALTAPTVSAATGTTPDQVTVTATLAGSNIGTTLKVACVPTTGATCPNASGAGITWTDATTAIAQQIGVTVDGTAMDGGESYTCYSAEFVGTDYRVCSTGIAVTAALTAPTVSAATGTTPDEVSVTATLAGTNTGTTLKVACVPTTGATCPNASGAGITWTDATTAIAQQIGVTVDGTAMDGGESYTCYSAEFVGTDYRVCSTGIAVTAALTAPTVSAATGTTPDEVSVTATLAGSNIGTTLKVACVPTTGATCPNASGTGITWTDATTAIAQQIGVTVDGTAMDGGESYTCYSAEFVGTDYRVCSTGIAVTAALTAPTVSAATGTTPDEVSVTATLAGSNIGTTLKVACVPTTGATCPNASGTGITWTDATTAIAQQIGVTVDGTAMDGGESYTCYSAEFVGTDYRVCSTGIAVTAALTAPTVTAVPGTVPDQVSVTATAAGTNTGTTLKVACVATAGASCPGASVVTWSTYDASNKQLASFFDGLGSASMVGGESYTCYSAEFVGTDYRVCSTTPVAVTAALTAPTVSIATGTTAYQVSVTATLAGSNTGTTLKVACVPTTGATCPGASAGIWTTAATATAQQIGTFFDGTATPANMVGGASYTCYAAEFVGTDYRVCSSAAADEAALAAPTVLAASGASVGSIFVKATNPTPANDATVLMKVACVTLTGNCPAQGATGWATVISGSNFEAQVTTLADGTGLVGGTSYTCWSAQFDTAGNYKCSAAGDSATAGDLNRPTVAAFTGTVAGKVSVIGTDSATPNQGTTLKVACGASTDGCPAYNAGGWVDATTDVAVQVSTLSDGTTALVGGTTYKCWALEYQTDRPANSICSNIGADVTANPLNAPSVTAATGTAQAIAVTATAAGTNTGTTLKMVCVVKSGASQPACPAASDGGWTPVTTSPQDITGLAGGDVYTCYSAEFANLPAGITATDADRVCSTTGADAMAGIIAPATPTAVPGAAADTIDVTAVAPSLPSNVDTTLKVTCVAKTGATPSCPAANAGGWTDVSSSPQIVGSLAAGQLYTCFAAEFADSPANTYRMCSDGADAVAALTAPTVVTATGTTADEVSVTATLAGTNTGTTLKVACVPTTGATCPNASGTGITWRDATSTVAMQIGKTVDNVDMDGGASYTCYAAEFVGTDYRVCSTGNAVTAALTAPTVSAATGTTPDQVTVTATLAGTNTGTTLKVACVPTTGATCPNASGAGITWTDATTANAQQIGVTVDGTAMDGGESYTCYSAEFVGTDYRVCSTGTAATAALTAPTVTAVPGTVPDQVSVTATLAGSNIGTTLKVACVPTASATCPGASAGIWTTASTATAQQLLSFYDGTATPANMVGGASYTCYAAEFVGTDYRVCSTGNAVTAALTAPTVSAATGTTPDQVTVTATLAGTNTGTTLKVACVPTTGATCPNASGAGITWTDATTASAQQIGVTVDGTAMDGGESYTCYSAEFVGTDYRVCSTTPVAVTAALTAPTVSIATGTTAYQVSVTATLAGSNTGTTLKVACVPTTGATCPGASAGIWTTASTATAQQIGTFFDGTTTPANMVGGASYTCYAAEFVGATYRVCSSAAADEAALAAPTVLAASGAVVDEVWVIGTDPSPPNAVGVTLKVACVGLSGSCPAIDAPGWVSVATSGQGERVDKLADGITTLVRGNSYTCWSAQFDTYGNYKCSATSDNATAGLLNRPTVAAAPGLIAGQVSVTGTQAYTPNQGTTLKVACGAFADACPVYNAGGWVDATTDVAVQVSTQSDGTALVGGITYKCWALEYQTDFPPNSICSNMGASVTANPLNPPGVSAATGSARAIDVTATRPSVPSNVDTTLKIVCVVKTGASQPPCPAANDNTAGWVEATSSPQAIGSLDGGDVYTCYSAEFANSPPNSYRECSTGADAMAGIIAPPTPTAAPGTTARTVAVTATAPSSPSNVDTTLKVACVPTAGASCPDASFSIWAAYIAGSPDIGTFYDGTSTAANMVGGTSYTCYSAEFANSPANTIRVCSNGVASVASLDAPTVVPATGTVPDQVSVTATLAGSNTGTTLKVACVPTTGATCPGASAGIWSPASTATAQQLSSFYNGATSLPMVGGASYTCYSAEFVGTDYRVCSTGSAVTAALTAPHCRGCHRHGPRPGDRDCDACRLQHGDGAQGGLRADDCRHLPWCVSWHLDDCFHCDRPAAFIVL